MIRTRALTRTFKAKDRTVEAVRGVDLDVEAGELVALLGPNGAGKSTTFRMLTTLLHPTSGTAEVVGRDVVEDAAGVRQRIGAIGQGNGAGHAQLVRDELVDQGCCYGLGRAASGVRADELLEAFELSDLASRVVRTLSGGQRRRLDIAMGLVHRPELLFLDEPSTGLDPQNRANLAEVIKELRADHGTTVMLTTHYLDEADTLADRVIIVDHGLVIADDPPQRLKSELVGDRLEVRTDPDARARAATLVETLLDTKDVVLEGVDAVVARGQDVAAVVPALVRACDEHGITLHDTWVERATLDDVFLKLTGRSLRESAVADEDAPTAPDETATDTEEAA